MKISSYQIHNVLRVYRERLLRHRGSEQGRRPMAGESVSAGGRRQAVIETVADNIIHRIIHSDDHHAAAATRHCRRKAAASGHARVGGTEEIRFVYNMIDKDDRKRRCVLSVEDPGFFLTAQVALY